MGTSKKQVETNPQQSVDRLNAAHSPIWANYSSSWVECKAYLVRANPVNSPSPKTVCDKGDNGLTVALPQFLKRTSLETVGLLVGVGLTEYLKPYLGGPSWTVFLFIVPPILALPAYDIINLFTGFAGRHRAARSWLTLFTGSPGFKVD